MLSKDSQIGVSVTFLVLTLSISMFIICKQETFTVAMVTRVV